jgi:hypothetical protein
LWRINYANSKTDRCRNTGAINPCADTDTDSYADTNTHSDTDSNTDTYANTNTHSDPYSNTDTNANRPAGEQRRRQQHSKHVRLGRVRLLCWSWWGRRERSLFVHPEHRESIPEWSIGAVLVRRHEQHALL